MSSAEALLCLGEDIDVAKLVVALIMSQERRLEPKTQAGFL